MPPAGTARPSLPVLLYHHVGAPARGRFTSLTITPDRFEQHVRWLARLGYRGVRLQDWLAARAGAERLPARPVLLTFDDGYADLARHAFPVLERYGFGATVFVVTGRIGGVNAWDTDAGAPPLPLLSAEQIRDWSARGIDFGSHGRSHARLSGLTDDVLADEVHGSRRELERITGERVRAFAYPYGAGDERALCCARDAYDVAFTADDGLNDDRTDPHLLRRTLVQPGDTMLELVLRARLGRDPLLRLRTRLRLRSRLRALAARGVAR